MSKDEKTITVENSFGKDKQITKSEFSGTWRRHAGQLLMIDASDEWTREVTAIVEKVITRCDAEFERVYAGQNS